MEKSWKISGSALSQRTQGSESRRTLLLPIGAYLTRRRSVSWLFGFNQGMLLALVTSKIITAREAFSVNTSRGGAIIGDLVCGLYSVLTLVTCEIFGVQKSFATGGAFVRPLRAIQMRLLVAVELACAVKRPLAPIYIAGEPTAWPRGLSPLRGLARPGRPHYSIPGCVDILDVRLHRRRLHCCLVFVDVLHDLVDQWLVLVIANEIKDGTEVQFGREGVHVSGVELLRWFLRHVNSDVWRLGLMTSVRAVKSGNMLVPWRGGTGRREEHMLCRRRPRGLGNAPLEHQAWRSPCLDLPLLLARVSRRGGRRRRACACSVVCEWVPRIGGCAGWRRRQWGGGGRV